MLFVDVHRACSAGDTKDCVKGDPPERAPHHCRRGVKGFDDCFEDVALPVVNNPVVFVEDDEVGALDLLDEEINNFPFDLHLTELIVALDAAARRAPDQLNHVGYIVLRAIQLEKMRGIYHCDHCGQLAVSENGVLVARCLVQLSSDVLWLRHTTHFNNDAIECIPFDFRHVMQLKIA